MSEHSADYDAPGCSWCPPDCRSGCTRDRDCECYAHQEEPDRHAEQR